MTSRHARKGYTLFEIVLVGAVLLLVAALTLPSFRNMHGYYKLTGAVDSVRAAWAQGRARAIEEGRPYRFAVESGGSQYRVAPDHPEFWSGTGGQGGEGTPPALVLQQALPSGVTFSINDEPAPVPPPTMDLVSTQPPATTTVPPESWASTVTFLPDGTSREDVKITFQIRGVQPTALQLRGLTGAVSVQKVPLSTPSSR